MTVAAQLRSFFQGPQPQSRAERRQMIDRTVDHLVTLYRDEVIAIGLYGSAARGTDQPYSDFEIYCVLDRAEFLNTQHEWVYSFGRGEYKLYNDEAVRQKATTVDTHWSLRQGRFLDVKPLYGNEAYFGQLKALVHSVPQAAFDKAICEILLGHYEAIGKLRNAQHTGQTRGLASLACTFAEFSALALGLANRITFSTGATLLEESVTLSDGPEGHAELCQLIGEGRLNNPDEITTAMEHAWAGFEAWVVRKELSLAEYLER